MVEARLGAPVVGVVGEGVRGWRERWTARVLLGGELQSMCLEFLSCSGKIIRGGLERSDGRLAM